MAKSEPYESDLTKFMRDLLEQNPQLEEDRKKGRAIWWDKEYNQEERDRFRASRVPQPGYVYFSLNRRK